MSHTLHHTSGLILERYHSGEADVFYQVLTPDLGVVRVLARGSRYQKSKLKPQLVLLDHVNLTLVRGREIWRLTAVTSSGRLAPLLATPAKKLIWARIANLLSRLVRGEGHQVELAADLLTGLEAFGRDELTSPERYEQLLVLRLLAHLGYVASVPPVAPWLGPNLWQETDWRAAPLPATQILAVINHGLHQSQL